MSREERRAYQRQMKGIERGPQVPAAARARSERNAARRAARRPASTGPAPFDTRFWLRSALIALGLGFLGFSLQWGEGMPWALYVGLIVGGIVLAILVGFRFLQRRLPSRS